jgi:hypothetical protein
VSARSRTFRFTTSGDFRAAHRHAASEPQLNDRVSICLDRTRQLFDSGDTLALMREQDCGYETDDLGGQYDRSNRDDHGGRR